MVTKKSSQKTAKTKTIKKAAPIKVDHNYFGKCFVAFGLIITALLFGFFYYMGQAKTHQEEKELEAFETLARTYIYDAYSEEGETAAHLDKIGVTADDDLYLEFTVTKYEDHVPTTRRKQRVHFQCDELEQENAKADGCAMAGWAGDWEEVPEDEKASN